MKWKLRIPWPENHLIKCRDFAAICFWKSGRDGLNTMCGVYCYLDAKDTDNGEGEIGTGLRFLK